MNTKFAAIATGLTMAVTVFSAGSAFGYANPRSVVSAELGTQYAAITPLAMQFFCAKNKSECASSSRGQVTMSPNLMAMLKTTNIQVNRAIRPKRDLADVWELNPKSGDCEDYVLSKRSALIRQGVAAGALRIAYTHTRRGEPHAVLVVKTSQGDFVLDNMNNTVKTLRASGYIIRSMSSKNPNRWVAG
ncbi:MAG: transglutaminase-like cysteine peptidase [Devosia sp.]